MVEQEEYERPGSKKKYPEVEFPVMHVVFDRDETGNPTFEAWSKNPELIRTLMKQNPLKKGRGG